MAQLAPYGVRISVLTQFSRSASQSKAAAQERIKLKADPPKT